MNISKYLFFLSLVNGVIYQTYAAPSSGPANPADIEQQQIIREQQRLKQFQEKMQPEVNVRLQPPQIEGTVNGLPQDEKPCFAIRSIKLNGDQAQRFQFALNKAINQSKFKPGLCLGSNGINYIMTLAQNAVIDRGYTTTRILASPQDLSSGELVLTVIPGRIHEIRYNLDNADQTHVNRIRRIQNEFPARSGDILNLRELEQGLENLKRVPTVEADIQIVPAEAPNESDVVVSWSQRKVPVRISFNADDSGSHATGRYQGGVTLSVDNPLGLSDLFYVNYNHDLGSKDSTVDIDGNRTGSGTHGYSLHYSVPVGNWLIAFNQNYYRYHQAIAGYDQNYDYNGSSENTDLGITRMIYRNSHRKIDVSARIWRRKSHNYIDDAEIEVQRRHTAGWAIGLNHQEYLGNAILNLSAGYKRGTGADHSLRAAEEEFGEGTSRMEIITLDASLMKPFRVGKYNFSYDTSFHGQWNKTPLITQDQVSIGGRYTVRGFDGELTLMGEQGWYWNNNLNWQYLPGHQVYAGIDVGHITGRTSEMQLGKTLAGTVLGFKGQIKAGGNWYYDVFMGKPIYKPQHFRTDKTTFGFNLNYSL
ncbi:MULTISPECIES: ShlB/FhaC/HecB family hemolysin secretion/activation protein [Snodgrassella]|uniref:ShlB/FhaC/HecB family hemolysin secretion/activation protein n=1 Tax=Snodgrassella TaxID=1193515 RepID=UPI0018DD6812|nr:MULTISPECIES: ShlB/FhaC/HecB family hemolysin secretion/activation protein [unclassified Snodgrassella]MBI0097722.1 ShlB/FhaC/HecB family hemolysin secretion/activation protein [Snodgrassella sp. W8134]MBI0100545.1 ShlB/FhaC/HecB family hemolysin secretion/activation protein [Snodgrassella sp. W8135]